MRIPKSAQHHLPASGYSEPFVYSMAALLNAGRPDLVKSAALAFQPTTSEQRFLRHKYIALGAQDSGEVDLADEYFERAADDAVTSADWCSVNAGLARNLYMHRGCRFSPSFMDINDLAISADPFALMPRLNRCAAITQLGDPADLKREAALLDQDFHPVLILEPTKKILASDKDYAALNRVLTTNHNI